MHGLRHESSPCGKARLYTVQNYQWSTAELGQCVCHGIYSKIVLVETHLDNVRVGPALMRLVVLSVFKQHFVHICAGILEQLVGTIENDECYLTVTQHAQLIGFLHQTKLSLRKRHLKKTEQGKNSWCID